MDRNPFMHSWLFFWNAAAYLGGEIKRPSTNIPLALFTGTFVVLCLYLLLNIVYIYALDAKQMSGVLEVGATSAVSLFGEHLSRYFSGAITIALLSVLSAGCEFNISVRKD